MNDRQMLTLRCANCGAPMRDVEPGEPTECESCGAEQLVGGAPEDDDELSGESDSDEEEDLWLDDDQALAIVSEHVEELSDDYDADEIIIELDDDNTDDERVYIYVKDGDDEVLDYFYVDREEGELQVYDYEDEEWVDP
ncbi:MAG: hypothetical protein JRI23_15820 [Deltaproteobacteria bacterium]|nr:hypothetical protein [Deltaproteobacteria bacterium]MBW2533232.1 hypothetical protein [Deltaproteobacteria bacterium]